MHDVSPWPCIAAAHRYDAQQRVPFKVAGEHGWVQAGSVARAHLATLAALAPPDALQVQAHEVRLVAAAEERSAALDRVNRQLHEAGLIRGWRDEIYVVTTAHTAPPLALIERAAARFWGTLTFGAHCNGYLADAAGSPTHLWIARRALDKATDPGLLDNLVGGGVPWSQTPFETLVREGWEEAGLSPELMRQARPGRVLHLHRDIPEGLQHEQLFVYDLALPPDVTPVNQDGEVAELRCLPVAEALALAAGREMTVDAALVMLDFALRHRLQPARHHTVLTDAAARLWVNVQAI